MCSEGVSCNDYGVVYLVDCWYFEDFEFGFECDEVDC